MEHNGEQAARATTIRGAIANIRKKLGLKDSLEVSLKDSIYKLEADIDLKDLAEDTEKNKKIWKFPFAWKSAMNKSTKKASKDKILFFYFNFKKGLIEPPQLLPYHGDIVIYNNKPYHVDPRAILNVQDKGKLVKAYCYKDYDRRPITSDDYRQVIQDGYGTESDELLIKAWLAAKIASVKASVNKWVLIIGGLLLVGGLIWFFTKG